MATVLTEKCSVCSAPYLNSQKWSSVKTRSASSKRSSTKANLKYKILNENYESRNDFVLSRTSIPQKESSIEDEYVKQLQKQIRFLESDCQYLYPFSSCFVIF